MSKLDRYIITELLSPFGLGITAFTSIIAGSTVLLPLITRAVEFGISITHTIQIFLYKIPALLSFTFPMSMLLASIVVFGRMNADSEIIAFRASGISFYRLVAPVLALGVAISLFSIAFNEFVVPGSSFKAEKLYQSLKNSGPRIQKNINITEYDKEGLPSRILNVREVDKQDLKDITVAEYDQGQLARVIRAKEGQWDSSGGWEFRQGVMHSFFANELQKVMVIEFEKEFIEIGINLRDPDKIKKTADEMSAAELKASIDYKKRTGQDTTEDLIQYHVKFALPFASLLFAMLGVSVGLRPHRSSSATGLGMSLLIILVYYILFSLGMGMGLAQILPPIIAAWLPNAVVGIAGVTLLRRLAYS